MRPCASAYSSCSSSRPSSSSSASSGAFPRPRRTSSDPTTPSPPSATPGAMRPPSLSRWMWRARPLRSFIPARHHTQTSSQQGFFNFTGSAQPRDFFSKLDQFAPTALPVYHDAHSCSPSSGTGEPFHRRKEIVASVAVIMDYQNMHLTGHDRFTPPGIPKHESLIHPLLFAEEVIKRREEALAPQRMAQKPNLPPRAELAKVMVFRGCPSNHKDPEAYNRSQKQKAEWTRDPRVEIIYRSLRYSWDSAVNDWRKQEKGIDVLVALTAYQLSVSGAFDVVILASHDTDMIPVIERYDADRTDRSGFLEIAHWEGCKRLQAPGIQTWRTTLGAPSFVHSRDRKDYT